MSDKSLTTFTGLVVDLLKIIMEVRKWSLSSVSCGLFFLGFFYFFYREDQGREGSSGVWGRYLHDRSHFISHHYFLLCCFHCL